jgi:hypothetical protein
MIVMIILKDGETGTEVDVRRIEDINDAGRVISEADLIAKQLEKRLDDLKGLAEAMTQGTEAEQAARCCH